MNIFLKSNREFNQSQIADLLGVISHATTCLRLASQACELGDFGAPDGVRPKGLDGGCRTSLEVTLVYACERLDKILNDELRWKTPAEDSQPVALAFTHGQLELQRQDIEKGLAQLKAIGERLEMETEAVKQRLELETQAIAQRLTTQTELVRQSAEMAIEQQICEQQHPKKRPSKSKTGDKSPAD